MLTILLCLMFLCWLVLVVSVLSFLCPHSVFVCSGGEEEDVDDWPAFGTPADCFQLSCVFKLTCEMHASQMVAFPVESEISHFLFI